MRKGGIIMRSLVPWNAYQELSTWHRDIDELFRRFFPEEGEASGNLFSNWVPAMEVFERDGHYVVRADLPGINPNELEISVVNDSLVVKGERRKSDEVKETDYHYTETAYGRFERRWALPKGVDRDKVAAKYENGVLEISVPLPQSATMKKVPIEIGATEKKQLEAS
jgi:HSP20 family protein